jgi:hypothetical protein
LLVGDNSRGVLIMANILQGIHEYLRHISCMFLICFVGGVALLITGIRILRLKKVTLIAPKYLGQSWYEPDTIKGKRSTFWGKAYIAFGVFLLFASILMLSVN